MDEVVLTEVAEEIGFDVTDQMEVTKYLKGRVCTRMLFLFPSFTTKLINIGSRTGQRIDSKSQ